MDLQIEDGRTALHLSIEEGFTEAAVLLIKSGANVNSKNNVAETPLMLAIKNRQLDTIECLIEAGADLRAIDSHGQNVLAYAKKYGREDIFPFVLAYYSKTLMHNTEKHPVSPILSSGLIAHKHQALNAHYAYYKDRFS